MSTDNLAVGRLASRYAKSITMSAKSRGDFRVGAAHASAQRWIESSRIADMIEKTGVQAMDVSANSGIINDAGMDLAADHVTAVHLAGMADSFPGITARGGTLHGLPVVTSSSLRRIGGSPATDGSIVLLDADGVWLADDGEAAIMASKHGAVEMSDAPAGSATTPTGASLVSFFQTNGTGLRIVRWMNWQARRDNISAVLTNVSY